MNKQNQMIALELTRICFDKSLTTVPEEVLKTYQKLLANLEEQENIIEDIDKIKYQLGDMTHRINELFTLLKIDESSNFVLKEDILEILGGKEEDGE